MFDYVASCQDKGQGHMHSIGIWNFCTVKIKKNLKPEYITEITLKFD